jgi:hypothetical protein
MHPGPAQKRLSTPKSLMAFSNLDAFVVMEVGKMERSWSSSGRIASTRSNIFASRNACLVTALVSAAVEAHPRKTEIRVPGESWHLLSYNFKASHQALGRKSVLRSQYSAKYPGKDFICPFTSTFDENQ